MARFKNENATNIENKNKEFLKIQQRESRKKKKNRKKRLRSMEDRMRQYSLYLIAALEGRNFFFNEGKVIFITVMNENFQETSKQTKKSCYLNIKIIIYSMG